MIALAQVDRIAGSVADSPKASPGLVSHGSAEAAIRFAAVLGLFTLATVIIFWPWIAHPHAALIGPPEDNMNDFWDTWYAATGQDPTHFFTTNLLRFPEGTLLIYQSFAWPQIFAVVGLSRIFGSDVSTLVALQNITLLASFPLAGTGAFYLVRHLAKSTAGGLIGGFVFAFNPSHVAHALHHAGVSSIEFLPFFVLAYLLALERRNVVWLGIAVMFYALSALSCWYYLFYATYFIGFQLLYERVRDGAWPRGWHLAAPALCLLSVAAILSPLVVPMVMAARPSVYDSGANTFVADLAAYVAFPPEHAMSALSHALYRRFTGYPWEATVYLGLINLVALVWLGIRTGLARNSLTFYVVLGMAVFAALASGESLHVAGAITPLHMPDAVLDKLPFFANIRSPSRAIVFVYLFLAVGVGHAAATALQRGGAAWRFGVMAAMALIVLDFYPFNLSATPIACPKGLAVLQADPDRGFGVLNLPFGYAEEDSYMLEQTCHGRPIVGGATAREMGITLANRLSLNDLARQRRQLAKAHVKYIMLHRPVGGFYRWSSDFAPVARFLKTYRVLYEGPDMTVLRVY